MLEQESDRAVGAEIAVVLGESMPHVRHGARLVVGHAVDDHGRTGNAVTFVADFLVVDAFEVAGAALDRALDVVLRHVVGVGLVDRQPQTRVGPRIAAAHARRDGDFLDEAGKNLAALGVLLALAVLDVRPLAVTCHVCPVDCRLFRLFILNSFAAPQWRRPKRNDRTDIIDSTAQILTQRSTGTP